MASGVTLTPRDAYALSRVHRKVKNTPAPIHGTPRQVVGAGLRSSSLCVVVVNNTSELLEAFSVVRLGRAITKEKIEQDEEFPACNYVWEITAPDSELTGTYGIIQHDAPVGERVLAMISGVSKVRLDDTDEGELAGPVAASYDKLATGDTGIFPVLGVETTGNADTWGYVLMGGGVGGSASGTAEEPYVMLGTTETDAQEDTWDRDEQPSGYDGVLYRGPRTVWDGTTGKLYYFKRDVVHDSIGLLKSISAETRVTIDTARVCS